MKKLNCKLLICFTSLVLLVTTGTVMGQKISDPPADDPDILFNKGYGLLFQGSYDESIAIFDVARKEYTKRKNERRIISCYLGIATCYSLKGDFSKSLRFNEKALSLHKKSKDNDQESLELILSNIALCKDVCRTSKMSFKRD